MLEKFSVGDGIMSKHIYNQLAKPIKNKHA